jgi:hypothetical protein
VYVIGKVTACPANGEDGDGEPTVIEDDALTLTVTVCDTGDVVVVVPLVAVCVPAVAVTFAVLLVKSDVCALPFWSVVTTADESEPLSVENVTGTPGRLLPFASETVATIAELPPAAGTVPGFALSAILATAAAPIPILSPPFVPVLAPPEVAVIDAVPDVEPALKIAVARPLMSVSTSDG